MAVLGRNSEQGMTAALSHGVPWPEVSRHSLLSSDVYDETRSFASVLGGLSVAANTCESNGFPTIFETD